MTEGLDIRALKERDPVRARFLVTDKRLYTTRDGRPYLRLQLMNRSGLIDAVLWDDAESAFHMLTGPESEPRVVEVRGVVVLYQQERQIRIQSIAPVPAEEAGLDAFLPVSTREPREMEEELHRTIRRVRNPFLRRLLEDVFRDPEVWRPFSRAPAAKRMHHACRGGLLEHTLSVARLVQLATKHYSYLDADLLLAAALVHDLGKAWELEAGPGFAYSDEGRLVGHILLGYSVLERKIAAIPEFPPDLALALKHVVISHHGEMALGSPKEPMTLEAVCLHYLDNLDAKLAGIREYLLEEAAPGKRWTSFHRVHQQYFYIPEALPEEEAGPLGGGPDDEAGAREAGDEVPSLFEDQGKGRDSSSTRFETHSSGAGQDSDPRKSGKQEP